MTDGSSDIARAANRGRANSRCLAGIDEYLRKNELTGHLLLHCKDGIISKMELRNVIRVGDPIPPPLPDVAEQG